VPLAELGRVENPLTAAAAVVLDRWLCNIDRRQIMFSRVHGGRRFRVTLVDNGFCFGGSEWKFDDAPRYGICSCPELYAFIRGWDSFEPWLSRAISLPEDAIRRASLDIPAEWYGGAGSDLDRITEQIINRRAHIPDLISSMRNSRPTLFANWTRRSIAGAYHPRRIIPRVTPRRKLTPSLSVQSASLGSHSSM
jgi:hypothetical protein